MKNVITIVKIMLVNGATTESPEGLGYDTTEI